MSKFVFLFLAIWLICISGNSQSLAVSKKIYTIKLKDMVERAPDLIDSVHVGDNTPFNIVFDKHGSDPSVVVRSISLLQAGVRQDASVNLELQSYSLGNDSSYTFTFTLAKQVSLKRDSTFTMVKIRYKSPSDKEVKDSLIDKKSQLDVISSLSKTYLISEQHDTSIVKKLMDSAYQDERQIAVTFFRVGKTKTELEKTIETISGRVEDLFNQKSEKKAIGYFSLKSKLVKVSTKDISDTSKHFDKMIEIKRVEIVLADGCIAKKGIMVELFDGRIFRNNRAPISVYQLNRRTTDILELQDNRERTYISLGDLLSYNYSGKFHYPDETSASLSPVKMTDSIFNFLTINDLIEVSIYTDLLGLVGRTPNGLLQTQISGDFITNTRNFKNQDIIAFNFIRPYFRLTKFDSRFAQVDPTFLKNDSLINRLHLNQIAYLQAGLKINLFSTGLGPNQQLRMNLGTDVSLTSADSLFKRDITTVNYYPEIEYRVNRLENFGIETSMKWLFQNVSKNSPFVNKAGIWIFNPQVTVYYYPFGNIGSKIYVRYANYAEINEGKYNFSQFQFGFKTNLFQKK